MDILLLLFASVLFTPISSALTCEDPPLSYAKFCNASLSIHERVNDLVSRMTIDQMITQTATIGPAVEDLAIIEYNYGGEALHGLWSTCAFDNVTASSSNRTACPTQFPSPITLGSSFNRDLWRSAADVASTEARAIYEHNKIIRPSTTPGKSLEGPIGLSYYAPNINLMRDPRWGRTEEVPSEDPMMAGEYGRAFVNGFQFGQNAGREERRPYYIKAVATVKHFLAYSLEWDYGRNVDRHSFDAQVSKRDIIESYTPAFEAAVDAGAAAVMCSYNAVNGEPACTDAEHLDGLLRGTFGFDGLVATDCGALKDAHVNHKRYSTEVETVTAAIRAGVDSNCGHYLPKALPWAIGNGTLDEKDLVPGASRLMETRFRLGLFDTGNGGAGGAIPSFGIEYVDSPEHRAIALDAARQGIVLLQNEGDTPLLPLVGASQSGKISSEESRDVALIGPNANASLNLLAGYHGTPPFPPISVLKAMQGAWPDEVLYANGCTVNGAAGDNNSLVEAVSTAQKADLVVLVLGLCGNNNDGEDPDGNCATETETEGKDRRNLLLPGRQQELLERVVATGKDVVLVMVNAGPVDISWAKKNVRSILWVGYGGQSGGTAIVDVLLGRYNPGGALPYTVYPQKFADLVDFADMGMRANTTSKNPGRTYRFLDTSIVEPLWKFGHGISFTAFSIDFVQAPADHAVVMTGETTEWIVEVHNTGKAAGGIVVTCFVAAKKQSEVADPPIKSLFDFGRVEGLQPGESRLVTMTLTPRARSLVTQDGEWIEPEGTFVVECEAGGTVSTGKRAITVTRDGVRCGCCDKRIFFYIFISLLLMSQGRLFK